MDVIDAQQRAAMQRRAAEPWYQQSQAAIQAAQAGDNSPDNRLFCMPFFCGRWDDDAARAHVVVAVNDHVRSRASRLLRARSIRPADHQSPG